MATVIHRTTKLVLESVNTPEYSSVDWVVYTGASQSKLDAFNTLRLTVSVIYIKFDGSDNASEMTAGEKTSVDNAIASAAATAASEQNLVDRTEAVAVVSTHVTVEGKTARALTAILVDELNSVRQWLAAFKVEVAAATTLADLKTRVASLPAMPDRTLAQAKTAVTNKINAGTVD